MFGEEIPHPLLEIRLIIAVAVAEKHRSLFGPPILRFAPPSMDAVSPPALHLNVLDQDAGRRLAQFDMTWAVEELVLQQQQKGQNSEISDRK
jgi:hypothetical protein